MYNEWANNGCVSIIKHVGGIDRDCSLIIARVRLTIPLLHVTYLVMQTTYTDDDDYAFLVLIYLCAILSNCM